MIVNTRIVKMKEPLKIAKSIIEINGTSKEVFEILNSDGMPCFTISFYSEEQAIEFLDSNYRGKKYEITAD